CNRMIPMKATGTLRIVLAGLASVLLSSPSRLPAQTEQLPAASPPVEVKPAPAEAAPALAAPAVEIIDDDHGHGHFHFLGDGSPFNFKKVPPVRIIPKPGNFAMAPKGE